MTVVMRHTGNKNILSNDGFGQKILSVFVNFLSLSTKVYEYLLKYAHNNNKCKSKVGKIKQ
jgi:hypothetical protein